MQRGTCPIIHVRCACLGFLACHWNVLTRLRACFFWAQEREAEVTLKMKKRARLSVCVSILVLAAIGLLLPAIPSYRLCAITMYRNDNGTYTGSYVLMGQMFVSLLYLLTGIGPNIVLKIAGTTCSLPLVLRR